METVLIALFVLLFVASCVYIVWMTIKYERKLNKQEIYIASLQADVEKMTSEWFRCDVELKESESELALLRMSKESANKAPADSLADSIKSLYNMDDAKEKKNYEDLTKALTWTGENDERI